MTTADGHYLAADLNTAGPRMSRWEPHTPAQAERREEEVMYAGVRHCVTSANGSRVLSDR
jgi:hypothetical protein